MTEKHRPFYELFKPETPISLTSVIKKETFDSVKKELSDTC